jgi:hypothetical protein
MNHILIIDNSYSMTQRSASHLSLLEVAKTVAETYIKNRILMPETKGDRYFVFTTDKDTKRDLGSFACAADIHSVLEGLRSISPSYHCDMFFALKSVLEFVNAYRIVTEKDNYFGGRDILKSENTNVGFLVDCRYS